MAVGVPSLSPAWPPATLGAMARGRTVMRGVVVGLGLLGAVVGGAVAPPAHDVGQHPTGFAAPSGFRPFDGLGAPVHLDHGDEEHRPGPPHELSGRHVATGQNVVAAVSSGRRAESSGPAASETRVSLAVVLLAYLVVAGLTMAGRRIRPTPA